MRRTLASRSSVDFLDRRPPGSWAVALLALPLAVACTKQLPPAPTPDRVVPEVAAATPPADGQGRLVVDVVEGSTPVHRVRMASERLEDDKGRESWRFHEAPELACPASPCVLDVPVGNLLLGFPVLGDEDRLEVELVHVSAEPTVYRRSLSVYDDDTGALLVLGILAASIGGASAITGVALLPVGLSKENDGLAIAGGITLGAGALLVALGTWFINLDSRTFRPGSAAHYTMP